jgi:hypothetical protein
MLLSRTGCVPALASSFRHSQCFLALATRTGRVFHLRHLLHLRQCLLGYCHGFQSILLYLTGRVPALASSIRHPQCFLALATRTGRVFHLRHLLHLRQCLLCYCHGFQSTLLYRTGCVPALDSSIRHPQCFLALANHIRSMS